MIMLTTENGDGPSNTIFLELFVYDHLVRYVESIKSDQTKRSKRTLEGS